MKKSFILLSVMAIATMFVSCSNEENFVSGGAQQDELPQTEVYMQGTFLTANADAEAPAFSFFGTRASSDELKWPYVDAANGWESARFSIRADNNVQDYLDHSSVEYFGRSPGKPGHNRGKVTSLYPYGHYNDRGYDYYKKDKATGENIGMFRYVYDPKGLKTQLVILERPTVKEILDDELADIETELAANKNVTKNNANKAKIQAWYDLDEANPGYLESHVLWYVVKEVGMRYGWHVNGVIADNPVPGPDKIDKVPDDVEIDIHQQEHTDWNAIKTSIHVRADVESLKLNIPLKYDDIVEADDFDIRVYKEWYLEYDPVQVKITHDDNGVTIEVTDIPASLIEKMKNDFGDGLTIEIYTYTKKDDIWEDLKGSHVISKGKPVTVKGQITTALDPSKFKELYTD